MWSRSVRAKPHPPGATLDRPDHEAGDVVLDVQREHRTHQLEIVVIAEPVVAEHSATQRDALVEVDVHEEPPLGAEQGFSHGPGVEELRVVAVEGQIDPERDPLLSVGRAGQEQRKGPREQYGSGESHRETALYRRTLTNAVLG